MSDCLSENKNKAKATMSDYLNLPQELFVEILVRVPVEDLVKSTAVCKSWNSLIKTPTFISTHLEITISFNNSTNTHLLLFRLCTLAELQPGPVEWFAEHYYLRFDNKDVDEYKQLHYPSPEFGTLRACFEVSGSVNGLVFLVDEKGFAYDYILWNPLIKKLVRLPQPGVTFTSYGPHHRAFTGFGFDSKTNDYKVLRFVESLFNAPGKEPEVEVEIYSLNANCWRSITHIAPKYSLSRTSPRSYANCFVNGAIHRLATDKDRNLILAFDVSDQVFREIPLPECLSNVKPMSLIRLLKYGQSIAALTWDWDLRDANIKVEQIHMWVMKEYGVAMSWTFMEVAESVQRVLFFRHDEEQMFVPLEGGWIASVDIKNNHSEIFGSTLHTMKRKS